MFLFELLDKPLNWQERTAPRDDIRAYTFETRDGRNFAVTFHHNDQTMNKEPIWEVAFYNQGDGRGQNGRFLKTNDGGELEIFATVIQIIKDFISKNPGTVVMFSAEEMNRQTLYLRMIGRYIKPPMAFEMDGQEFYIGPKDIIDELDL